VHAPAGGRRHCLLGGICSASQSPLIAFQGGVLSITPPSTQWVDACPPSLHDEVSMIIFLLLPLFSLLHLKRCASLAKLQTDPQSLNCIKLNLFIFQFHLFAFNFFMFLLSSLILIVLISNFFLLIFFDWILSFDLIPNHLILISSFC
jgi:hypothetical protein